MPKATRSKSSNPAVPRAAKRNPHPAVAPGAVIHELEKHLLVDGFKLVIDLQRSKGSRLVDAPTGREILDLYSFYASMPIGYNHPYFDRPEVEADLLAAAKIKVASADVYSVQYATFVETFSRVVGLPPLNRYFFIGGGSGFACGGEDQSRQCGRLLSPVRDVCGNIFASRGIAAAEPLFLHRRWKRICLRRRRSKSPVRTFTQSSTRRLWKHFRESWDCRR